MKRILLSLLLAALLLPDAGACALEAAASAPLPISAPSALLMEKETGEVLYEKNADERLPPASVTKVMTLLLLFEDLDAGRLQPDETVTASERAASFGGSCVYLETGEQMSVREMLKCIAVVSANDCAVAMAEHVCGTEAVFVERMNRRAEELGLENTHFTNCTGLFDDPEHYTSARDVALCSRELLRHPAIRDYSRIWMDSIRGGSFELVNTNKLVSRYPGCTGLKTGYTSGALYCLSATAERDGVEYIAVVMHCDSSEQRNTDAAVLLNYAFANFTLWPLLPETALPVLPVEMGEAEGAALRAEGERFLLAPRRAAAPQITMELPERLRAPVAEGERIGTLRVEQDGETVAELPLLAAVSVPRLGFGGIFLRLAGGLFGLSPGGARASRDAAGTSCPRN